MTSLNYKLLPRQHRQCFSRQVKQQRLEAFRQDTLHWQACDNGVNFALRTSAQLDSLDDIFKILAQGANHYLQNGVGAGNGVGKWVGSVLWVRI